MAEKLDNKDPDNFTAFKFVLQCRLCSCDFGADARHTKFCSVDHRGDYHADLAAKSYIHATKTVKECVICGGSFETFRAGKHTCGARCARKLYVNSHPDYLERARTYKEKNKEALKEKRAAYSKKNKETIAAKSKAKRLADPEEYKARKARYLEKEGAKDKAYASAAAYREKNRVAINAKARERHHKTRDYRLKKHAEWYEANVERARAISKKYRQDNKEMVAGKHRVWRKEYVSSGRSAEAKRRNARMKRTAARRRAANVEISKLREAMNND